MRMLMVVGRGDACIETNYRSNDRTQNDQEQLNDLIGATELRLDSATIAVLDHASA